MQTNFSFNTFLQLLYNKMTEDLNNLSTEAEILQKEIQSVNEKEEKKMSSSEDRELTLDEKLAMIEEEMGEDPKEEEEEKEEELPELTDEQVVEFSQMFKRFLKISIYNCKPGVISRKGFGLICFKKHIFASFRVCAHQAKSVFLKNIWLNQYFNLRISFQMLENF